MDFKLNSDANLLKIERDPNLFYDS